MEIKNKEHLLIETIKDCNLKYYNLLKIIDLIKELKRSKERGDQDIIKLIWHELISQYNQVEELEQTVYYLLNIYKTKDFNDITSETIEDFVILNEFILSFISINDDILNNHSNYSEQNNNPLLEDSNENKNSYTIEDIKNTLDETLKSNLDEETYSLIKVQIENIERSITNNTSKTLYETIKYHFENDDISKFKIYLDYKSKISSIEREKFILQRECFEKSNIIDSLHLNIYYKKLLYHFLEHLNFEAIEANQLTISILSEIKEDLLNISKIDERICLLKDFKSIYSIKETPLKINFVTQKKQKIEINSPSIINHVISKLNNIIGNNYPYKKDVLNSQIKTLEFEKKKVSYILMKKITTALISNKIMTFISSGNKLNLTNEHGIKIGLQKKDAEIIYDILKTLGVEIKKIKGPDKDDIVLYYDKAEVIKERLETAKSIYKYYQTKKIENFFLDLT